MLGEPALDLHRAGDAAIGVGEGDEEPVAGVIDLLAVMIVERRSEHVVVPPAEVVP